MYKEISESQHKENQAIVKVLLEVAASLGIAMFPNELLSKYSGVIRDLMDTSYRNGFMKGVGSNKYGKDQYNQGLKDVQDVLDEYRNLLMLGYEANLEDMLDKKLGKLKKK